jgi:hypothetical protein
MPTLKRMRSFTFSPHRMHHLSSTAINNPRLCHSFRQKHAAAALSVFSRSLPWSVIILCYASIYVCLANLPPSSPFTPLLLLAISPLKRRRTPQSDWNWPSAVHHTTSYCDETQRKLCVRQSSQLVKKATPNMKDQSAPKEAMNKAGNLKHALC